MKKFKFRGKYCSICDIWNQGIYQIPCFPLQLVYFGHVPWRGSGWGDSCVRVKSPTRQISFLNYILRALLMPDGIESAVVRYLQSGIKKRVDLPV